MYPRLGNYLAVCQILPCCDNLIIKLQEGDGGELLFFIPEIGQHQLAQSLLRDLIGHGNDAVAVLFLQDLDAAQFARADLDGNDTLVTSTC